MYSVRIGGSEENTWKEKIGLQARDFVTTL